VSIRRAQPVSVVGAGLAGALLAILLARRGFAVTLYERRRDPRRGAAEAGRSINLALAARGIRALEHAGIMERVRPLMIEMRGRLVHEVGRPAVLLPYGQRADEVIYSIERAALNRLLIEEALRFPGLALRFGTLCNGVDVAQDVLQLQDAASGRSYAAPLTPTIATDGAGSVVRASLQRAGLASVREEPLDHDYKELTIPARAGRYALEPHALHIWPRHGFMLIALPNTDRSFTATLFLPRTGPVSFARLEDSAEIDPFFAREFPDAVPLLPQLSQQFTTHPQGHMGTVHTAPWHAADHVLLLGDAAHAIVPFHGQGMNAAFEDCYALDRLLETHTDWGALFADFERERRANVAAIAQMAVENYGEMRERVLDARFLRQQAWALELERRFPERFIPRYSMVMFHPEISYAAALHRGAVQQEILDTLTAHAGDSSAPNWTLADNLIRTRL